MKFPVKSGWACLLASLAVSAPLLAAGTPEPVGPVAAPPPDMGMPDTGGMDMDMGMDMGGFDF